MSGHLASDGFRLVISDMDEDTLNETLEEFKNNDIEASSYAGDVTKYEGQEALVKHRWIHLVKLMYSLIMQGLKEKSVL
ncbi:hypothetical protein AAK882_03190 [Carnobacteriaceae bacterium 52-44]